MRTYKCGCQTVPVGEIPPGVTYAKLDPRAAENAGWRKRSNAKDGEHWHKACAKHRGKARSALDGLLEAMAEQRGKGWPFS